MGSWRRKRIDGQLEERADRWAAGGERGYMGRWRREGKDGQLEERGDIWAAGGERG